MLNFAVVGCGHVAKKHIQAISELNEAYLYALCDTDSSRLQALSNSVPSVKMYTDFEQMLKQKEIHIINICTPSGTHAPLAIKAANAKKHIILEKPMALKLKDADEIIKACDENNVKLTVVHPNRFRPAVKELKKAVEEKQFGMISHINATLRWNRNQEYYNQASWRGRKDEDGGVLMNQAIHNLDLLIWLAGEVEEVQAYTATRLRKIEAEDIAVAILKFKNGELGVIEATSTIYPENFEESISVFGEHGTAVIGGTTANWIKHWRLSNESRKQSEARKKNIEGDPFGIPGHQRIIQDMVEAVYNNRQPLVTGEDGRNALALVLAIYKAAEQKGPFEPRNIK